jgi:hypothetical protein
MAVEGGKMRGREAPLIDLSQGDVIWAILKEKADLLEQAAARGPDEGFSLIFLTQIHINLSQKPPLDRSRRFFLRHLLARKNLS